VLHTTGTYLSSVSSVTFAVMRRGRLRDDGNSVDVVEGGGGGRRGGVAIVATEMKGEG
jgi:hypothetical protein